MYDGVVNKHEYSGIDIGKESKFRVRFEISIPSREAVTFIVGGTVE